MSSWIPVPSRTRSSANFPEAVDKVLEMIGTVTLEDSLQCAKQGGSVCMTGIVGNKWSFDQFSPMEAIPTAVCLTVYAGDSEDFMRTPLNELARQIEAGRLCVQIAKTFHLDDIVLAHRLMEETKPVERSFFSPEGACRAETKYLSSRTL